MILAVVYSEVPKAGETLVVSGSLLVAGRSDSPMPIAKFLRRVPLLGVLIAGGATAMLIIVTSLDPDNYFYYRHDAERNWSYPAAGVVGTCIAVATEAAIAAAALRPSASSRFWKRGLVALLPLLIWSAAVTGFLLHMPVFVLVHHVWLLLLVASLSAGVVASGLAATISKLRLLRSSATI